MARKRWSWSEKNQLLRLLEKEESVEEIAKILGRSVQAVINKKNDLRIDDRPSSKKLG
jgi:hypothetical protein